MPTPIYTMYIRGALPLSLSPHEGRAPRPRERLLKSPSYYYSLGLKTILEGIEAVEVVYCRKCFVILLLCGVEVGRRVELNVLFVFGIDKVSEAYIIGVIVRVKGYFNLCQSQRDVTNVRYSFFKTFRSRAK